MADKKKPEYVVEIEVNESNDANALWGHYQDIPETFVSPRLALKAIKETAEAGGRYRVVRVASHATVSLIEKRVVAST